MVGVLQEKIEDIMALIKGNPQHPDPLFHTAHPFQAGQKFISLYQCNASSPQHLVFLFGKISTVLPALATIAPKAAVDSAKAIFLVYHNHTDMGVMASQQVRKILKPEIVGDRLFHSLQKATLTKEELERIVLPIPDIPLCFIHMKPGQICDCGIGSGQ